MQKNIVILDQTLRDGEQQALINFTQEQKLELASAIKAVGVDYIDLMPISNVVEQETARKLSNYPLLISTPLTRGAIDMALELKKDIVLFQAVSDSLLNIRGKTRAENIAEFKTYLAEIRERGGSGIKIYVAGEDTSRAEQSYLIEFLKNIEEYIDGFFIADSIGYLIPEKTRELVTILKRNFAVPIGIHAHNDLGFADENTVAAVLSGVDIISGTFTGIGERAGNANLGNVLRILKEKHDISLDQVNYDQIPKTEELVEKFAGRGPAKPLSPESFYVESGIHVHALLRYPTAYSLIDPNLLNYEHKVFFSKKSGISNFKWYLGEKYTDEVYTQWRDVIKQASIEENKSFTFEEVKEKLKI